MFDIVETHVNNDDIAPDQFCEDGDEMSVEGSDDEGAQDQDDENIPSDESGEYSAEGSNLESDFESEEEM
jgi:hypothetical protein